MPSPWFSRLVKRFRPGAPIRRHRGLQLEALEDRSQPAAFSAVSSTLELVLGLNDQVQIESTGSAYTLTLTDTTWTGTDGTDVSGNGTGTLTVSSAGIAALTAGVLITDVGSAGGDAVTFGPSPLAQPFANNFTIDLTNATAGTGTPALAFAGHTTFASGVSLTATVNGDVVVDAGAGINMAGGALSLAATGPNAPLTLNGGILDTTGDVTLRATGDLTEAAGVTVNTGGAVELSADVTAGGTGDNGIGTLTIDGDVYGASIDLRGADEDISPAANVGSATAVAPTVSTIASGALASPQGLASAPLATCTSPMRAAIRSAR